MWGTVIKIQVMAEETGEETKSFAFSKNWLALNKNQEKTSSGSKLRIKPADIIILAGQKDDRYLTFVSNNQIPLQQEGC